MRRPRLLDLFCGAGGAGMGYHRAGFDVVGVDVMAQPDYPFTFHRADATTFPLDGFDAVHASPPCQRFTTLRGLHAHRLHLFDPTVDLLTPMLERLHEWDCGTEIAWVVENVAGAPLPEAETITLCGSMFGLRVRRHRLFACSYELTAPPCDHAGQGPVVGVYGTGGAWDSTGRGGGGGVKVAGADAADALGIDWTTRQASLAEAIPPAYTEHVGRQLREWIG